MRYSEIIKINILQCFDEVKYQVLIPDNFDKNRHNSYTRCRKLSEKLQLIIHFFLCTVDFPSPPKCPINKTCHVIVNVCPKVFK